MDLQILTEDNLNSSAIHQFESWYLDAKNGVYEPTAMSLSTVSSEGRPSQRTVLLKSFDEQGFVFFTNYNSSKAEEMSHNAHVSLLFPWYQQKRQVVIHGAAKKISAAESLKYFLSRPRGSQIGAWTSQQSSVVSSRNVLLQEFNKLKDKFSKGEIPLPPYWGGYRVAANSIEFWQGREFRLNDRFLYTRNDDQSWNTQRLAP